MVVQSWRWNEKVVIEVDFVILNCGRMQAYSISYLLHTGRALQSSSITQNIAKHLNYLSTVGKFLWNVEWYKKVYIKLKYICVLFNLKVMMYHDN